MDNFENELSVLKLLSENPSATGYELKYGKAPGRVVRDIIELPTEYESLEIIDPEDYSIEMVEEFEIELEQDGIVLEDDNENGVIVTQNLAQER